MSENKIGTAVKSIDSVIFDCFKNLTSSNEQERLNAGLLMIQHLTKTTKTEKSQKEINYALKRLIRGVGASTTISRAGFFTTLVGFLRSITTDDLNVENVLKTAKRELHISGAVSNKEDADAVVGQILTCGAIVRSNKIAEAKREDLEELSKILVGASKYRSYHSALAYSFLVELLNNVNPEQFSKIVWPVLEPEIIKPWEKQNINSIHCLIAAKNKFPDIINAKYLKANIGASHILHPGSYEQLLKIFWDNTTTTVIIHPAFEAFGKYVSKCKHLEEFWTTHVDEYLKNPNKLRELETLKILTDVLLNADTNKVRVSSLLTENFIKMITTSLKSTKIKKDETLKAFYDDFFEALQQCAVTLDDDEKVIIIHKLILHPGILSLEKYTSTRIIHRLITSLGENGIYKIFETYKNIFLNKLTKNSGDTNDTWLNVERQNAGYMLQTLINHKNVQTSFDWRAEQLKFMMTIGLFYVDNDGQINSQKEDADTGVNNEFANQMKNIFYTSLQSKLSHLKNEKKVLMSLVEFCNEIIQKKNFNKYFRIKIDDKKLKAWNEMYEQIHTTKTKYKKKDKLTLVFHILLLHMGLQLFREPEMAEAAILDLEKCMQRTNKIPEKLNGENNDDDEPEWIEVVVDLFLHLLSQNTSALRNVVNSVFPHLCENLTLSAIHQILSVLDMRDGNNPLSDNLNENEDDDNESDKTEKTDDDEEVSDGDEDDDDDDDEEEEEEIMEEEDEDVTITDQLRNAVSIALSQTTGNDDDQDSVNLDDMDEEEGMRLDEALAAAFSSVKKPEHGKRSKVYRVKTTTVMHFRIRVLDLIEIYIQHNPNLLYSVEIMLSLFNMIEFCTEKDLKPLSLKLDKVLNKLTSLRQFSNTDDITEKNICDYLRLVIDKKVRSPAFEAHNKLRAKCCIFLITCAKTLSSISSSENVSNDILQVIQEYLHDFIKSRNPTVNITLLSDIFKMRWQGVWQLAIILIKNGLQETTRTFRRIQIIELLDILYKNHELIRQNLKLAKKSLKNLEGQIQQHIATLSQKNEISVREFSTILDVLFTSHRCHNKISLESYFDVETICKNIQDIRRKIKLENSHSYTRFCQIYSVKIIKNCEIVKPTVTVLENGTYEINTSEEDDVENEKIKETTKKKDKNTKTNIEIEHNGETERRGVKRAQSNNKDLRKEKKLKKEGRLKAASEGLNGGLSFTGTIADLDVPDGDASADSDSD